MANGEAPSQVILSTETRPYDPGLLNRATERLKAEVAGTLPLDPDVTDHEPVIHHPTGEIPEGVFTLRGLASFLTAAGRADRQAERPERAEVVAWVAKRISNPRKWTDDTRLRTGVWRTEKIGWTGVHKREEDSLPRPEDLENLGFQLMTGGPHYKDMLLTPDKRVGIRDPRTGKIIPKQPEAVLYRPTRWKERRDTTRLNALWRKRNEARHQRQWLEHSYGSSAEHQLSGSERRHMRRINRQINGLGDREDRLMLRFHGVVERAQQPNLARETRKLNREWVAHQPPVKRVTGEATTVSPIVPAIERGQAIMASHRAWMVGKEAERIEEKGSTAPEAVDQARKLRQKQVRLQRKAQQHNLKSSELKKQKKEVDVTGWM